MWTLLAAIGALALLVFVVLALARIGVVLGEELPVIRHALATSSERAGAGGGADPARVAAMELEISSLRALVNDIDERSERRYKSISQRARRAGADGAVQHEDDPEEAIAALHRQLTQPPAAPVLNGPHVPRMVPPPRR